MEPLKPPLRTSLLMVRESNVNTLVDALEAVENVATTLSQALTPQLEGVLEVIGREDQQ